MDNGEPVVADGVGAQSGRAVGVQIVPDDDDRGAELQVSADQEVAVVLPGEALACPFEEGEWKRAGRSAGTSRRAGSSTSRRPRCVAWTVHAL